MPHALTTPPRAIYRASVTVQAYAPGWDDALGEPYDVTAYGESEHAAVAACEAAVQAGAPWPWPHLEYVAPDLGSDEHFAGAIRVERVESARCAACKARALAGRLHVDACEPTELLCHRCHAHLWGECPDCGAPDETGCSCPDELAETPLTAAECGRPGGW